MQVDRSPSFAQGRPLDPGPGRADPYAVLPARHTVGGMDRPSLQDALANKDVVLRAFFDAQGRLSSIPTKLSKRLVVLDRIAQDFEIGRRYPEAQVNVILRRYHDDVAALRRYLVENEFLERRDGEYWRAGGTVEDV